MLIHSIIIYFIIFILYMTQFYQVYQLFSFFYHIILLNLTILVFVNKFVIFTILMIIKFIAITRFITISKFTIITRFINITVIAKFINYFIKQFMIYLVHKINFVKYSYHIILD